MFYWEDLIKGIYLNSGVATFLILFLYLKLKSWFYRIRGCLKNGSSQDKLNILTTAIYF